MNTSHAVRETEQASKATFKAAVIDKPRSIAFVNENKPKCSPREILVKLEGVGLCASNIPVWEGREWFEYPLAPGVPGHEGWGTIVQKGELVSDFHIGQRVALLKENVFAEYVSVPADNAVAMPAELDGLPFPGEALGCLMNIFKRADIQEGQTVAIIGLGFLGQGLVRLCKQAGTNVLALSRRDASLQLAADDADLCIKMDDHYRIINTVQKETSGKGCERVIECTGKQWPLDLAGEIIADYGKLIIAGYHQDGLRTVNMQQWNWKAIDVINGHERDPAKYKAGILAAIDAVSTGLLKPQELITHSFPFENLGDALNILTDCPEGYIKGYIKF